MGPLLLLLFEVYLFAPSEASLLLLFEVYLFAPCEASLLLLFEVYLFAPSEARENGPRSTLLIQPAGLGPSYQVQQVLFHLIIISLRLLFIILIINASVPYWKTRMKASENYK